MCFTILGRLQTRLASLGAPCLLTLLVATITDKRDYWTLFWLMAAVGLSLEVALYGWLIGYQPRWLTLLLAGLEFGILKWIMEWPYPFEIRLRTRQALEFYLLAWLLSWLTVQMILPLLFPRWGEDDGEFKLTTGQRWQWLRPGVGSISQRRRTYGRALVLLGMGALPWLVAAIRVPVGHHFTGLLLMESRHLLALADATTAARSGVVHSLGGSIGWLARQGRWPVLQLYMLIWGIAGMAWLVGIQCCRRGRPLSITYLVAIGGLPLLVLPTPWLLVAALAAWGKVLILGRLPHFSQLEQHLLPLLLLVTLLVWGIAWGRGVSAPLALVDEGTWQALAWLRQSVPPDTTVAAPPHTAELVEAFSGLTAVGSEESAMLRLTSGEACEEVEVRFRHGDVCVADPYRLGTSKGE